MNEEELLASGLPELTEEQLLQLQIQAEQSANTPEFLGDEEPQVAETAPTQTQEQPQVLQQQEQQAPAQAVETSPFKNDDGTIDYEKIDRYGAEGDMDVVTGLYDFVQPLLNAIPGIDLKQAPKFENQVAQTVREISSIVLPTMALGGVGTGALAGAANKVRHVNNLKFLNNAPVKWLGEKAFAAGSGAFVDYVVPMNQTDDNLTGSLQKAWPRSWGWLPDQIATLDSDSPETKRWKNVLEGSYLGLAIDMVQGFAKLKAKVSKTHELLKHVPEDETGKAWFKKNVVIDESPEDVVIRSGAKRTDELDEVGSYNFDKATDPTEDVFGFNDSYAPQESGIRSVDDLGIVGATIDGVRIDNNLGTINGRVGSVMSEGALKFANESGENAESVILGLASVLKDSGKYGYKISDSRYISHAEILENGMKRANEFYEMDLGELQRSLQPGSIYMPGKDADTGVAMMTTEAVVGALGGIRKYMDDFINMDVAKARTYVATSYAGQISDMAEGARLTSGSGSIQRAQEQILDRVEFLMSQKGQTTYARGRALNLLNLRNRMTTLGTAAADKAEMSRINNAIASEKNKTLKGLESERLKATALTNNLREIHKTNPEMLGPLMLAWEISDGNIKTITGLNKYVEQSTSIWKKAFYDGQPDIPSVINRAFFSQVYNSVLSAVSTPVVAGISASHLLVEKPLRHFGGALWNRDFETIQRGWYQYSTKLDSVSRAMSYAGKILKKSAIDPNVTAVRDDLGKIGGKQLELLHAFGDAHADKGDYGPQSLMETVQAMVDLADSPSMRLGTRAMQAIDGFTSSMIADFESKGRAFDEVTKGGTLPFNYKRGQELAKKAHAKMFDGDGIITDEAVLKASGEISLNLDNQANKDLSQLIRRMPILKPFLLFTKTPLNELALTASYNPLGLFVKDLTVFKQKFDDMPMEEIEEILTARGIEVNPVTAKAKYNELRADIMGRKAIGTIATTLGVGLFMGDRLHGTGHYNRQVQKTRDESNWKRSAIQGLDGKWHSFQGLGPITNYLNLVADIMDNFDSLSPNNVGELLKKSAYIFGASFKDKTYMAGLEPFMDVMRGDAGAINRWAGGFIPAAAMPGSSQMAEIARLMDPGMKMINNDLTGMIMNRNPFTKWMLPKKNHWITGEEVNVPDSMWARIRNTYTPWKVNDKISPEEQFLIDIEYDATATLRTDGRGTKLSNDEQSEILNSIGKDGFWEAGIKKVMSGTSGKEFRKLFREAEAAGVMPDKSNLKNIHRKLDNELRGAILDAQVSSVHYTKVQRRSEAAKRKAEYLQSGNIDGAKRYLEYVKNKFGI